MGKLHTMWKNAKASAKKSFDALYKAKVKEFKDQGKDDKEVQNALNDLGLDKGANFTDYLPFKGKFGPSLDELEKQYACLEKADSQIGALTLDQATSGNFAAAFKVFCEKSYVDENWSFYTTGYKLPPDKAYEKYTKRGAPEELNLPNEMFNEWKQAKDSGFNDKSACDKLLKESRDAINRLMKKDSLPRFGKTAGYRAAYGYKGYTEYKKMWDNVEKVRSLYSKQLKKVGSELPFFEPGVWSVPLREVLKKIKTAMLADLKPEPDFIPGAS